MAASHSTVIVAVMGVTGCGKSSFIKRVTRRSDVRVGDSLTSETAVVQEYKFSHNDINYVLVDTPGFDDTYTDNETVAKRVVEWLSNSYRRGRRLNGLIYLHRITDQRMSGSSFENLRMFRELCGDRGLKNVVLTSTFWDTVSRDQGEKRLKELETSTQFWSRMIAKGCKTARLDGQRSSCLRILESIAKNNGKVTIQIQKEIVDEGKAIEDTAAARETFQRLRTEMQEEIKRDAEALRREEKCKLKDIEESNRKERERVRAELQKRRKAEAERLRREEEQIRAKEEEARARETAEQQKKLEDMKKREERLARKKKQEEARTAYESRQSYYRKYRCRRGECRKLICSTCRCTIKHTSYYHCCFCNYDDYDHCIRCGSQCPVSEHPTMKLCHTVEGDCIVM